MLQIWGKGADQNFAPFLPTGPALSNFIKILSLFNTQANRPRASPAIFKHVGQVPYSRGFKFGEKGPIKILSHICLLVRRFSTHKLIGLEPPPQFLSMYKVPYSRGFKFGEKGPIKILSHIWSGAVEFHQNFKSFQHTT